MCVLGYNSNKIEIIKNKTGRKFSIIWKLSKIFEITHESQNHKKVCVCVCVFYMVRRKFAVSHAYILETLKGLGNIMNSFMQIENSDEIGKFFEKDSFFKN